jgi:hypothetical protein
MSLVDIKVEFGFDFLTAEEKKFTFDSSSDGILGTSELGGYLFYDVTEFVKSVSVVRGRSRQLDSFNAGIATVTLNNANRDFDPTNIDSPYYPGIVPRSLVRITCRSKPVFYGFVNDWDLDFDISYQDVVTAQCSDAFMVLSNQSILAFTPSQELPGQRINTILSRPEVAYVGGREISAGKSLLGSFAVSAETNVLNYLKSVESSEVGFLFVDQSGDLIFLGRGDQDVVSVKDFADDGTALPYQSLSNQYGDELLFNYVSAQSQAGAAQVAVNQASINKYQVSQLNRSNLLNSSTSAVSSVASILVSQFNEPKLRFTGFSVQMLGISDEDKDDILDIDLVQLVNIKKSFVTGNPLSITQSSLISGISHAISPGSHIVSFVVENAEKIFFLVLGDTVSGVLDSYILDF